MTDWKAITLDYASLASYDDTETISICLTQRQVAILKGLLITAYWRTRWTNISISDDELQSDIALLDSQLDGNDCEVETMEFRDNPDDPCEVQYSNDGGETWTTMFRKDVCPPDVALTAVDIENTYIDIDNVTTNNTNYAGDIINVAPEWAYEDAGSDNALCYVVNAYVNSICDLAIKQIDTKNDENRSQNDWLDDIAVLIAELVLDVALATAGIGTLPALLIGAVSWASVQFVEYVWDSLVGLSSDHYADQDARDTVACWMYNKLKGGTPVFAKWSASLDAFEGDNANEVAIGDTVALFNKELDYYINYMMLMEEVNVVQHLLPSCACPEELIIDQLVGPTSEDFFGTEFTQPTSIPLGNPVDTWSVAPGTWLPISEVYWSVANPEGGQACNIEVVLPDNHLVVQIRVKWGAARPAGFPVGDKNAAFFLGNSNDPSDFIAGHSWGTGVYEDQNITTTVNGEFGILPTPRTHLFIHNSIDRTDGSCYIQWIHVICIPYVP